ncbi:hypothetical protein ES288_D07G031200v1 [Gossypium darwinii]|uniref:GH18 domain-containing protein n=1 Tax=Gossypium darwinii TaxID=34276 RepID=A0A5D2BRL3_GOSDA|nr:hypothetical protein ES288_D07G031200v1 [Gossypium darwinii]
MAAKLLSFLLFCSHFLLQLHFSAGQNVVRAAYWSADSGFPVPDIDSTLFTHLFCAFADIDSQTNQVTVSSASQARFSTFTETVQLKNPSIKTLLSIDFASMASQANTRKSFIDSSIKLARPNSFHGLDLDWENLSTLPQKTNLGLLLQEWRAAVDKESATLYNPGTQLSGDYGIRSWTQSGSGIPSNKLVLGLPFHGYAWRLVDANNHGFSAPASGPAVSPKGELGYGQIKNFISANRATKVYDAAVGSNYCYAGTTWIGYDDTESIRAKVSYVKQNGLLGYFAWHVGADDEGRTLSRAATGS